MSNSSDNISWPHAFPPSANISRVLAASSPSFFATKAFADPHSGYPQGLRLGSALNDNDTGRFSLVSGLVVAGGAAATAAAKTAQIQQKMLEVQQRLSMLSSNTINDGEKSVQRILLHQDLQEISQSISDAKIGNYNLLDASESKGIQVDIPTGKADTINTTGHQDVMGVDVHTLYHPDSIKYVTTDVRAAFDDFQNIEQLADPNSALSASSTSDAIFETFNRFAKVVSDTQKSLTDFQKTINETAQQYITINNDPNTAVNDGSDARQMASRLAQQLSSQHYNITANPALRYFSLFS